MVKDLKKCQSEVNILDQKNGCYSIAENPHQTLNNIRLERPSDSEVHQQQDFAILIASLLCQSKKWIKHLTISYQSSYLRNCKF